MNQRRIKILVSSILICFLIGIYWGAIQTEALTFEQMLELSHLEYDFTNEYVDETLNEYNNPWLDILDYKDRAEIIVNIQNEVLYWNLIGMSDGRAYRLANKIYDSSIEHGVCPYLFTAMGIIESNLTPGIINNYSGAIGMYQIMPATANYLDINPYNTEENIWGGAKFISELLNRYDDINLALAHYNAGSNPEYKMYAYKETRNYIWNINNIRDSLL